MMKFTFTSGVYNNICKKLTNHIDCCLFDLYRLIDLARRLDKADRESLSRCAHHLAKLEQYGYAAEVYSKMGDHKSLIMLHVDAKHWEDVSNTASSST